MNRTHIVRQATILATLLGLVACGSEPPASNPTLDRVAWLGSVEGWGLLGFPLEGGPLSYLRAENLESPTWAPPELGALLGVWPGEGEVWVQFRDTRMGVYDYDTGHQLNFDSLRVPVTAATALEDGSGLVVATKDGRLRRVGGGEPWSYRLEGEPLDLIAAGGSRVVVLIEGEPANLILVLEPPGPEALARKQVGNVAELAVLPSGERVYYGVEDGGEASLRGLSLPELAEAESYPLPEPAKTIALTPSGHRVYVALSESLYVIDRLRQRPVGQVPLGEPATALRFSINGTNLLARLPGRDRFAVLRTGVDSLLGIVPGRWDAVSPLALPGGRIVTLSADSLVLYDATRLIELVRAERGEQVEWLPVNWQPPRPRIELASAATEEAAPEVPVAVGGDGELGEGSDSVVAAGHYAVVSAAQQRPGVDELARWLRGVGYPGVVDLHRDAAGVEWFRAMVGPYARREQAEAAAQSLSARYGYKPWILQVEPNAAEEENEGTPPDSVSGAAEGEGRSDRPGRGEPPPGRA